MAQSDDDATGIASQVVNVSVAHSVTLPNLAICKVEAQGFHGILKVLPCSPVSGLSVDRAVSVIACYSAHLSPGGLSRVRGRVKRMAGATG
jgi:hypothetical protein